jgi:archaellum biogenesis ATPase FlaH
MVDIKSFKDEIGFQYKRPNQDNLNLFKKGLDVVDIAQDYLKIQKNLSEDTIENFNLGFDVVNQSITIPETKNREIVNVAYRSIEKDVKERYRKDRGCENWIFNEKGVDVAREKGGILIVSNQFDAMSAWQAGFKNVVSVPVGKEATGSYMELFDSIPKVYICFENTKVSKKYALEFATRIGVDKCYEVLLPSDIQDINVFFKVKDSEEFKNLIRESKAYYKYKFKGLTDIIESLKQKVDNTLSVSCIPFIEFEEDWLVVLSGSSNSGKTSHSLNVAKELCERGYATLFMPFERGIRTVGKRFLQVHLAKTQTQINEMNEAQWNEVIPDIVDLPLYFSVPSREEIKDIVARSKKLFNIKVIIVDHLDYLVRKSGENHNVETSNTLQEFKSLAQEFNIIFIVIHHTKKPEGVGGATKKLKMEDLKGSSSTYQDPEAVIMLSSPEKGLIEVDIVKNKGTMGSKIFEFDSATGVVGKDMTDTPELEVRVPRQGNLDKF